jgi:endonuclease G, mitochondrial
MRTGLTMADMDLELTGRQREQLCDALISAFPTRTEMARMVNFKLDVDLEVIAGGETFADVVFNLVRWAVAQGKIEALVTGARQQNPGNPSLRAFDEQALPKPKRKASSSLTGQASTTVPTDAGEFPFVPLPGSRGGDAQFAFVDVEFVGNWYVLLRQAAAAVCRLELHNSMATAFLIGPDLAMTCYHVLKELIDGSHYENPVTGERTALTPEGVALRFGYILAADGVTLYRGDVYRLAADWLVDSSPTEELDYVLLRTNGTPGTDEIEDNVGRRARDWLHPPEAYEFQRQAPLYVLQHANGRPLQISYGTGAQMKDQGTRFEFQTLTAPGASGAPCFSAGWQLVGMYESKQGGFTRQSIPMAAIVAQPKVRSALGHHAG